MEAAGLVLAVLPLLVNGLTGFAKALETFETFRKPSKEYARYGRSLRRELLKYQTTLTELLEGIVDDEDDLQAMTQDSHHPLWRSRQYDSALRQRLANSYDTFLDTIDEVEEELQEIVERLGLRRNGNVDKNDSEDFCKKELQRFKMAFKKDTYAELYQHIQSLNDYLSNTTQASIRIEEKRRKSNTRGKDTARIQRLREHARNIHQSVVVGDMYWSCACKHKVMLKIRSSQQRSDPFPRYWQLDVSEPKVQRWHLLELYPEERDQMGEVVLVDVSAKRGDKDKKTIKWQIPIPDHQPPPYSVTQMKTNSMNTNIRIDNLCSSLESHSRLVGSEMGYLALNKESWRCRVSYKNTHVYSDVETLSQLLVRNAEKRSAAEVVFSRRERLAAAATLAYSILFLDGSWLKPVWNSSDVVLLRNVDKLNDERGVWHSVHELAFPWTVCDSKSATAMDKDSEEKYQKLKMFRKTAVLFALAMALIELSLGEPLEKVKTEEERSMDFVWGNIAAASRLLPRVQDASGFEYHEVVRRCLDCPFDIRDPSMDNEAFLSVCFDEIVRPLISDYEQFIGLR